MVFLDYLKLPNYEEETDFRFSQKRTCFDTFYPFFIFSQKGLSRVDFSDITILYGGNGSGKSTFLNVLANKIDASHDSVYNRSNFFETYVDMCTLEYADKTYSNKEMLTSDGVFDVMLDIRNLNQGIDNKREEAFEEYFHLKNLNSYDAVPGTPLGDELAELKRDPIGNLDKLRRKTLSMTKTQSKYVRNTVADNVREQSNGESAFEYFVKKIDRDGIYILDEPENSLSPSRQMELVKFMEDSVRFFNCQFVIATHSPFVLSLDRAKIYDLDSTPVDIKRWTELENVRTYYDFFKAHDSEF